LGIADALFGVGATLICLDDRKRAKEFQEEGIALAREVGYVSTLTRFLFSLGYTLLLEGDYERGASLTEEGATLTLEHGYAESSPVFVLHNLGWVALLRGDHERAKTSYEEGLARCKELGEKLLAPESLEGLACVAGAEGEAERAAKLFGAAEALRGALSVRPEPDLRKLQEPYLVMARSQLEEGAWTEAWEEGRAMSMEQAIEYALSHDAPTSPATERSPADEPLNLTSREREVATLVASGLTNHQIAQELVLSEHTVTTHVRNILKKLNLHSRTQLTLWVTEQQQSHP
jgi:non-specific serine/threonine protein kinase